MDEFEHMAKRQRKWMLYLLGIFLIGAIITPFERVFLGLALGHTVSYYSLRLLHNRTKTFGQAAIEGRKILGLGTFLRLMGVAIAIFIALRFEHKIHTISVVLGLITLYIVLIIDYTIYAIQQSNSK